MIVRRRQFDCGNLPFYPTLLVSQHLGVHSEMFSDGVLPLVESGVITGQKKTREAGKLVAAFVIGSQVSMILLVEVGGSSEGGLWMLVCLEGVHCATEGVGKPVRLPFFIGLCTYHKKIRRGGGSAPFFLIFPARRM